MIFLLAFWLFLLGALAIGWQAGDRHDRKAIGSIMAAAALSTTSHMLFEEQVSLILLAIIDIGLLAVMVRYALSSQRYWPIWFAGFHATALVFGFAALLLPTDQHVMAERIGAFWAIPALIAMVVGLLADQRHGIVNAR